MGWSNEEINTSNKMDLSSKILLGIIVCVVLIIILILVLLMNIQNNQYIISVDMEEKTVTKNELLTNIDGTTYINIQKFAELVDYEYHQGEYKAYAIEDNKCYVKGDNETATFYENDNIIYKLPVNDVTSEYQKYSMEKETKKIGNAMYVAKDSIEKAFNVVLDEKEKSFEIYTLDYLVDFYDNRTKEWGYSGISEQSFENKKAILYGYLIVNKEKGLYKVIDNENKKEIVSERYSSIEFVESTQEFLVTNEQKQMGIINSDGTIKIEPIYDSIKIVEKNDEMYLIEKDKKFGIIKSGNNVIVPVQYDDIGLKNTINTDKQYFINNKFIPVLKNGKYGIFDITGKKILDTLYDGLGCNFTSVEINGEKKAVEPVLIIERCNGIVVKQNDKYGILTLDGKELVPIAVESVYSMKETNNEEEKYFMIYNGKEMNIIKRLIEVGLLKEEENEEHSMQQSNNQLVVVTDNSNSIGATTSNMISNKIY